MRRFQFDRIALLATTLAGLSAINAASAATLAEDAASVCSGLAGSSGAVTIDAATLQAPSPLSVAERGPTPSGRVTPANPAFCKVLGSIAPTDAKAPPIKFEVNLPVEWNGRSLQYGGGGFNGVLISGLGLPPAYPFDKPSPLARGFVTYGTDSGHEPRHRLAASYADTLSGWMTDTHGRTRAPSKWRQGCTESRCPFRATACTPSTSMQSLTVIRSS